jgi:hypothetical protein
MFLPSKLEHNLGYELIQSTLGVDVQDCEIVLDVLLFHLTGLKQKLRVKRSIMGFGCSFHVPRS